MQDGRSAMTDSRRGESLPIKQTIPDGWLGEVVHPRGRVSAYTGRDPGAEIEAIPAEVKHVNAVTMGSMHEGEAS